MDHYNTSSRLGLSTKEYLEELRLREELIKKILKAQQTVTMAGAYELGSEVKAKIIRFTGLNNLTFKTEILTKDHFVMMKTVRHIKYQNGSLMYLARPHTSDLGQIKLLYEPERSKMSRCRIEDLYTINQNGCLRLQATALLIDHGIRVRRIGLQFLYDTPQMLSYYKEIEPEAKFGRIYLGEPIPRDFKDSAINSYFRDKIRGSPRKEYTVKILGYEDNVYDIDLIDNGNKSIITHLRNKFHDRIEEFESKHKEKPIKNGYISSELEVVRHLKPQPYATRNLGRSSTRGRSVQSIYREPIIRRYNGVIEYFKEKFSLIEDRDDTTSFLRKRFFGVKVICWDDPETFFIIPDDVDYYTHHDEFLKELEACQVISEGDLEKSELSNRPYALGQKCLFRNEFDYKLGKWLRGVIIEVPCITQNGNILPPSEKNNDIKNGWINANTKKSVDKCVYKVRSIDYGFQCVRSPANLRPIKNENMFLSRGPWSLRCKLFGIEPIEYDPESSSGYSSFCLEMIDSWMRTKILGAGKYSYLSVLFRTDIVDLPNHWQSDNFKANISLFHRQEPPYRIEDTIMPRKRRSHYQCLNWFLVERGLASDYIRRLKASSNIELDQHTVNLLVPHDRI